MCQRESLRHLEDPRDYILAGKVQPVNFTTAQRMWSSTGSGVPQKHFVLWSYSPECRCSSPCTNPCTAAGAFGIVGGSVGGSLLQGVISRQRPVQISFAGRNLVVP